MPLSTAELVRIQDDQLADDVPIPPNATEWSEEQAIDYFASGGAIVPHDGTLRWAVDITTFLPSPRQWQVLTALLTKNEAEKCNRFHFQDDKKRALVSRIMQRAACALVGKISLADVQIDYTKGRKPFFANRPKLVHDPMPNWNYNVSHEGSYVVLAAEPWLLCGVDVAAPEQLRRGNRSFDKLLDTMRDSFTAREFTAVQQSGSDRRREDTFRKLWSLKEAFTKARGDGLGFKFERCEFTLQGPVSVGSIVEHAKICVDSAPRSDFAFFIQPLRDNHWISVARGPPAEAVDAFGTFRASLSRLDFAGGPQLHRCEPLFETRTIEDLLPRDAREKYLSAAHQM